MFDQRAVGELAVEFLSGHGHQSILALMPRSGDEVRYRADRIAGARRAATRMGVELHTVEATLDHDDMTARLRDALTENRPSAIYAFNDEYARAAQAAIHHIGLAIPTDIALLGCDDGPLARLGWPRLSSISPTNEIRWAAIARAVDDIVKGRTVDLAPLAELRVSARDTT